MSTFKVLTFSILVAQIYGTLYLIPHSHDDLGWLRTIDEYYNENVREILRQSITALENQPPDTPNHLKRKFVYSEIGFLKIWIEEDPSDSEAKINRIKKLIKNGKFEFVNGGMSMADNACPHYEDFINNYYSGLSYLERNFGVRTQIAWQLDPFGQSHSFYYIAAKFGMTDAVLRRIPHQMKIMMAQQKLSQFLWRLPLNQQITTHIIEHYRGMDSLNCDTNCNYSPLNNDSFNSEVRETQMRFIGSSFALYGDDFQWSQAQSRWQWAEQNLANKIEVQIALFTEYLQKFEEENNSLFEIEGDFFPYLERDGSRHHQAWTGYFSSKPAIKHAIKRSGMMLRAVKNLITTNLMTKDFPRPTYKEVLNEFRDLSELNALFVHHDTITGTSRDFVDLDYYERMEAIEIRLMKLVKKIVNEEFFTCDYTSMLGGEKPCTHLNNHIKYASKLKVQILNPTMSTRNQYNFFYVPAEFMEHYAWIVDSTNSYISSDGVCLEGMAYCMLIFKAELAKMPAKNDFTINFADKKVLYDMMDYNPGNLHMIYDNSTVTPPDHYAYRRAVGGSRVINGTFKVSFNDFDLIFSKKHVIFINSKENQINNTIYFEKIKGDGGDVYSVGYLDGQNFEEYNENLSLEYFVGRFIEGAIVVGTKLTYIIYKMVGKSYFQVDVITKHDREMNFYMDIIMVIKSSAIKNLNDEFYTESNGLFELKRKRVEKPDDSIYPTTSKAALKDQETKFGMSVFVDRSRGVFGQKNELHFYIQRTSKVGKGEVEMLFQKEDIFAKFYVSNYELGSENEVEMEIRNHLDVEAVHMFEKKYPGELSMWNWYNSGQVQKNVNMPSSLRYNTEMIAENTFLIRIQNIDRANTVHYDIANFLRSSFSNYHMFEVDFSFVFSESVGNLRSLSPGYAIEPFEFVCFYLKRM